MSQRNNLPQLIQSCRYRLHHNGWVLYGRDGSEKVITSKGHENNVYAFNAALAAIANRMGI